MKGISRHIALALLAGLALRLLFVLHFPASDDDSAAYLELAHNVIDHHAYGLYLSGVLTPVTYRMPGYPLFLAAIYALGGKSLAAVRLAQVAVDLWTCGLIALLAWSIAPMAQKRRAAVAALWLAALCPFIANYTAVVLTEVLATFWSAAALVAFAWALGAEVPRPVEKRVNSKAVYWMAAGACTGIGTLMRPETPILLVPAAIAIFALWWRPADWAKAVKAVALSAAGLLATLVPWTVRNWVTLHEFEPLVPRYIHLPGEFTTPGFIAWSQTWLVRYGELDDVLYKVGREPIQLADIPARAFDSVGEEARVEELLQQQNSDLVISPALDAQFGKLAQEREQAHPIRTHVGIPLRRIGTIWFTPRVELLPYSADLWPPWERAVDDPLEFSVSLGLWVISGAVIGLAILGWWRQKGRAEFVLLGAFVLLRTVFFAAVHFTPEPRFVLECFPVLVALAGLAAAGRRPGAGNARNLVL